MLELNHVGYTTEDGMEILKDITLKIDERFVAITGPNGGGLEGVAEELFHCGFEGVKTEGTILLDGVDITNMSITDRAKEGISFAFQQPVRFKGLKVRDLLRLAAGKDAKYSELKGYLEEVGLHAEDYINRELNSSLSGGELKRIEIAMIRARGTKLSLFDEPEAGIDLWSFQNLIKVFEEMHTTNHGSIIIISHQERILDIADKIVVIKDGTIDKYGDKEDILPQLLEGTGSMVC